METHEKILGEVFIGVNCQISPEVGPTVSFIQLYVQSNSHKVPLDLHEHNWEQRWAKEMPLCWNNERAVVSARASNGFLS